MARQSNLNLLGVSAFCESLGMMIQSGIDLNEAMSLLKQKKDSGILSEKIDVMEKCLSEGSSLKQAMEKAGSFPEYAIAMVEAGENTGKLEEVLFKLAHYYHKQDRISSKISTALTYPLIMLLMIIAVLLIMLKMVLPAFTGIYQTLAGSLSESSFAYINYAYAFCKIVLIIAVVIVVAGLICYFLYKGKGKKTVEKILRLDPNCARLLDDLAMYRFTAAYEVYLSSGYMQDEALNSACAMADYEPAEARLKKCREIMDEGRGFAYSANEAQLYEPIYGKMLIPAERSGNTEDTLAHLSDLLSDDAADRVEVITGKMESILSGVMMLSIGIALLSVMLPLIGIMNSIG